MSSSSELREHWRLFRIARMYRNQGEIIDRISANKKMNCPRCRAKMLWNDDYFYFYCPTRKCNYNERVDLHKDVRPRYMPPSGSRYWLETVSPPRWFYAECF